MLTKFGLPEEIWAGARLSTSGTADPAGVASAALPHGLLLPVPDHRRSTATVRLFPDPGPLETQPIDLAQLDSDRSDELDLQGPGNRFIPVPFVAGPLEPPSKVAIIAGHDLWALGIPTRTGVPTVSTFGDRLIGVAVRRAAELADGQCVILAPYLGPRLRRDAVRRVVALAGALCREVRIAFWHGKDLSAVPQLALQGTHRLRRRGVWTTGAAAAPGPVTLLRAEGPRVVVEELIGAGLRSAVRGLARYQVGRTNPAVSPPTERLRSYVSLTMQLAAQAALEGATLAPFGGVAIDVMVGGSVRERKDLDLAVSGGPEDMLHRLRKELERQGFSAVYRRAGEQVVVRRGDLVIDLYRLVTGRGGSLVLATRVAFYSFDPAGFFQARPFERLTVPVVNPVCVAAMKFGKIADFQRPVIRSAWIGMAGDRGDLSALAQAEGVSLVRRAGMRRVSHAQINPFELGGDR